MNENDMSSRRLDGDHLTAKSENDMSDEELEAFEQATEVVEDKWDRLELFRKKLAESHLEKMYHLKRSTKLGPTCPYYIKAKKLFERDQQQELVQDLRKLLEEFDG